MAREMSLQIQPNCDLRSRVPTTPQAPHRHCCSASSAVDMKSGKPHVTATSGPTFDAGLAWQPPLFAHVSIELFHDTFSFPSISRACGLSICRWELSSQVDGKHVWLALGQPKDTMKSHIESLWQQSQELFCPAD
jgi:hypothetical protein